MKPEHRQHRKIGPLTDREYRLWVGMLCEADDHGRLVAEPEQLRVTIWGYHRKVKADHVADALRHLQETGLIVLYRVETVLYASFPSWKDHQKVDHPGDSRIPEPIFASPREDSRDPSALGSGQPLDMVFASPREDSRALASVRGGSERIGSDRKGSLHLLSDSPSDGPRWGPRELIELYNAEAPDEAPAVKTISPQRIRKAAQYLKLFPERAWWAQVFTQMRRSTFLRGLAGKSNGHESFVADFDWLLTKGKDGSENCVKVHNGRYLDKGTTR